MLALKAWTNQLRGDLRVFCFGTVLAGIEVKAIFTMLKYVKIVPIGRFAQCYRSIFFQLALGSYGTINRAISLPAPHFRSVSIVKSLKNYVIWRYPLGFKVDD